MMKLSSSFDSTLAVADFVGTHSQLFLSLASEIFGKIASTYKKALTPYRRALLKRSGADELLGFSAEECLDAIRREMADAHVAPNADVPTATLRRLTKEAIWRLANLAESHEVFEMFRNNPNAALQHIHVQLADDYHSTADFVQKRNGYTLTAHDYACTIWLHLSAGGTWRAFDSYRGDGSIYKWMKQVCRHCIVDYVESCGYYSLIAPSPTDIDGEADEESTTQCPRSTKKLFHVDDYEGMQIADSRSTYDYDFVSDAPNFLLDRIEEMPWEEWEKDFITDSVVNGFSASELTAKYGAMVACLQGKATPFDRAWTDNRNSRMKRDLYAYALAYMHDDHKTLKAFANKAKAMNARCRKQAALKTA